MKIFLRTLSCMEASIDVGGNVHGGRSTKYNNWWAQSAAVVYCSVFPIACLDYCCAVVVCFSITSALSSIPSRFSLPRALQYVGSTVSWRSGCPSMPYLDLVSIVSVNIPQSSNIRWALRNNLFFSYVQKVQALQYSALKIQQHVRTYYSSRWCNNSSRYRRTAVAIYV